MIVDRIKRPPRTLTTKRAGVARILSPFAGAKPGDPPFHVFLGPTTWILSVEFLLDAPRGPTS